MVLFRKRESIRHIRKRSEEKSADVAKWRHITHPLAPRKAAPSKPGRMCRTGSPNVGATGFYQFNRKKRTRFKWWVVLDSNQRPRDYESPALTD
jgi:hypothetical protein